uniref:Glycoside hydrolase family 116 protein n=1 Tax=termite gut metagenome TaxID=433724 RepID=S0DGQ7_9ZZZZ
MHEFFYSGAKTNEISFPLGGIGSGCIGLAGNGRLIDWEIYNRPNKGSLNGFTHFAVKAEKSGKVLDARILNGNLPPPYSGSYHTPRFNQFGFGPCRETMAGFPHFRSTEFQGEFPTARVAFIGEHFPAKVHLTAFNPMIPMNDKDSSLPSAFFEIGIENTTADPLDYTVVFVVTNPAPSAGVENTLVEKDSMHALHLARNDLPKDDPAYGDLTVATCEKNVSYQEYLYRGNWFDDAGVYWNDLTQPGKFVNRSYSPGSVDKSGGNCNTLDSGLLAVHFTLAPGQSKSTRFILSWNFPNCYNYWKPEPGGKPTIWKNYYATLFEDSMTTAGYGLAHWDRLYQDTTAFHDSLFSSSLPRAVLDAVSGNLSILKSPTCLRLQNGAFYGFEGCHCDCGSCEGSCTHVWNYAYSLPFLFPALERSMRDLDFQYNLMDSGGMAFRLQLPLGRTPLFFRPCVDGQYGGVIKAYRDWKISGDDAWIKKHWDAIKANIDYAWSDQNPDRWDINQDGVIEGRQHHTLDMELFGANSWLTGFYLAALKAAAEIADHLGDAAHGRLYRRLFQSGKEWVDRQLFNGAYYHQEVDLHDAELLAPYRDGEVLTGHEITQAYWNEEAGEIKYQIGEGCCIDQVVAQWHANICGLGDIFDKEKRVSALASIYRYNFKRQIGEEKNPCRLFSLNQESGTIICAFPEGKRVPAIPVPYAEETMCGFEYQVATHMIQEGMVREGLDLVSAIRDRFDGEKRNPWNEFECGSNYARSMASYALLLAFSGFRFDMTRKLIGFKPIEEAEAQTFFWSLGTAWGTWSAGGGRVELLVQHGSIGLERVVFKRDTAEKIRAVTHLGHPVRYQLEAEDTVLLSEACTLGKNELLVFELADG